MVTAECLAGWAGQVGKDALFSGCVFGVPVWTFVFDAFKSVVGVDEVSK